MKKEFACIRRETLYSPNHEVSDYLICNLTAQYLSECYNVSIKFYDESNFDPHEIKEKVIFSMVQGPSGIEKLLELEDDDHLIINSPGSVLACYRYNLIKELPKADIPFPKSLEIPTIINTSLKNLNGFLSHSENIWVKRIDVHAVQKNDVQYVENSEHCIQEALEGFGERGIKKVVLQEHIPGDVVKFYGVGEVNYFHWYYLENKHNLSFDTDQLKKLAFKSAGVLGLYVFGGDAVISDQGNITIIDFNDWPSFAPIRNEASEEIAKLIYKKGIQYV